MSSIQATFDEIASRGERVRVFLKPLTPKSSGGPAWQPMSTPHSYIIGTHDGSRTKSSYRDWRFRTFVPNVYASYFETWQLTPDDLLSLDRAYLHIYRIEPATRSENEILCLHCDPDEPDNAPHALYKKGPHLHISAARPPIPHAHIPLNMVHLDIILSSIENLSEALELAVVMLKEEILEPLQSL